MSLTVRELLQWLDGVAPPALAEPWDNVGLQIGAPEAEVERALLTVDVTRQVLEEAARNGAGAVIAHHPVLLGEIASLRPDRWPGCVVAPLIEGRRALIVAHTNLDWSPTANTSAALAEALGLREWSRLHERPDGAGFLGVLAETEPLTMEELAERAGEALGTRPPRARGEAGRRVRRVAVVAGSGKGLLTRTLEAEAEAIIAGELGHHAGLEAAQLGLAVLELGHADSERPGMARLGEAASEKCEVLIAE
ncbi:MAG: Nif3-like dinuclear metal center hexameric protein [Armatimonadetes bacterium]|nr:Nif3-like dinuclear metal center hexameric protein [Armatimonadota bacterium]